jgi:hypothetical protein
MDISDVWRGRPERQQYWQTLPGGLVWIGLSGLLAFSSVGLTSDVEAGFRYPFWWVLVKTAVISLIYSVGTVAAVRRRKLVLLVVPAFIALVVLLSRFERLVPANLIMGDAAFAHIQSRLAIDGVLLTLCAVAGWALFVTFTGTQGVRHVRERTELELAERLQQTLAPPLSERNAQYEIHGKSVPSSQMGGDLLDAVEDGGELACYVGDVAGHGIQAGVFMGMIKSSARTALLRLSSLEELLADLNNVLIGVKAGLSTYVTFACLRCRKDGKVEYALAGHVPILHYRARSNAVSKLVMEQFPLGLFPNTTFESGSVIMEPGDMLVLLTDGLPETANQKDEQFGLDRIGEIVRGHRGGSLESMTETLFSAVRRHGRQDDDETLVLVRAL